MKHSCSNPGWFACRAGFVATAFMLAITGVFSGCSRSDNPTAKKGAGSGDPPVPVLVVKAPGAQLGLFRALLGRLARHDPGAQFD